MDVARRGRNAVVQLGVRTVLMRGITAVGTIVLARILAPADFGVFAVLVFWMSLLLQFGDLGLGASLVQQDHEPTRDELGTAWVMQQLMWIPVVAAVWLAAPVASQFFGDVHADFAWQLRVISLTLVTAGLRAVPASMLLRELRFGALATVEVTQHAVFYLTAVGLALAGFGAWSFVAAVMAQSVIGCLFVNVVWRHRPILRLRRDIARRQLRFGASFQTASLVAYTTLMATPLFGAFASGVAGIGQLQFAWRIGQLTAVFDDIVARVTFPAFSRLQGERERLGRIVRDAIVLSTLGVVATQGWVVAVAGSLVPVVFGDKWLPAVLALQLICIGTLISMPLRFLKSLVYSQGRAKQGLVATLISTGCLVVLAPPLVIALGLPGAAVASILASLVALVLFLRATGDITPEPWTAVVRVTVLSVPSVLLAWLTVTTINGIPGLIVSAVLFLALYGLLLLLFMRDDVRRGLSLLLARARPEVALAPLPLEPAAAAIWSDD